MHNKPHIRNGRFYNHAKDSIRFRLKNTFRTMFLIAKARLQGHGRKHRLIHDTNLADWAMTPSITNVSHDLTITWLGHATFLIQVDGYNILTDPVFYEISRLAGRFIKAPLTPNQLPKIDAVLISHNHRDHVDEKSLRALRHHQPAMLVPLGNKKWFERRGFCNVTEMNWGEQLVLGQGSEQITFSFLPASHWTSRGLFDLNHSLWGSWMISSAHHKVYFAGDSAYDQHFQAINKQFGAIDVALMPIGPNEPRSLMHDAHLSSEEAVKAFLELEARHFIPMHWGTFMFGLDRFIEPIDRLLACWQEHEALLEQKMLHVVKCGQSKLWNRGE